MFSKWRSRIGQSVRGIGLVALGMLSMELMARLDDHLTYGAPIWSDYNFEQLFNFDGAVVRGIPHARFAKWQLNSLGMRGPEPQPAHGQTKVLIYGASESFGIYETPGKEFPRVLETDLNTGGSPRFEVINAGIPGMRIGSGTAYLQSLGSQLKPDIVLLYPTPTHYIGVSKPLCGRPKKAVKPAGDAWPEWRIAQKSSDRIKEVLPPRALTALRQASIAWGMRGQTSLARVEPASLAAFETDLACAVQAVRAIGATPVVVTHANRFTATPQADDHYWLVGWRRQYPELREEGFIDLERQANVAIRRVAGSQGVTLIDADGALSGHPNYFADHAHFTDEGSRQMGALLAAAIRNMAPRAAPESTAH